uniref:Transmembrane protein 100 n=1 Tax=Accipiter nisus TaxID=211598 RepID=A0A8B9N1X4_9AVES
MVLTLCREEVKRLYGAAGSPAARSFGVSLPVGLPEVVFAAAWPWGQPGAVGSQLALATGGTEKSWYRCIFPFGIVSVVIGVAATCITFTINGPQMDIAKVVSVATLIFGVGLLVAAYVCWRAKRERQRKRQRQEPVSLEQGAL